MPVDVSGLAGSATRISVGGRFFSCAQIAGGTVQCWGDNGFQQIGDATGAQRNTPRTVEGLSGVASFDAGGYHSSARSVGGASLQCWGFNIAGQIGDGTRRFPLPSAAVGNAGVLTSIDGGETFSCATSLSGAAFCWGSNSAGQLGDGGERNRTTPGPVIGLSSGVSHVTTGGLHACARMQDGSVRCWGESASGQLGNGTVTKSFVPVAVTGLGVPFWRSAAVSSTPALCWIRAE